MLKSCTSIERILSMALNFRNNTKPHLTKDSGSLENSFSPNSAKRADGYIDMVRRSHK